MHRSHEKDDRVHNEHLLVFEISAYNIEYAKKRQWWITSQTLVIYGVLYFIFGEVNEHYEWKWPLIFISVAVLFLSILSIYDCHHWHRSERKRMDFLKFHSFHRTTKQASDAKFRYHEQNNYLYGINMQAFYGVSHAFVAFIGWFLLVHLICRTSPQ